MNPDGPPTLLEEECAALLAVCDDLLAQGEEPEVPDDSSLSPEVKGRLLRGVACLRRLEHIWPRQSSRKGTRIWDLHSSQQVGKELPGGDAFVAFSPDGRWLVNGTKDEYGFWEVGSWRPGLRIPRIPQALPGPLAFTTDGKILALAHSLREVRLVEAATGQELATLAAPEPHPIRSLDFRPDGEQLAVACEKGVLQLWDLRRIRERLAELGMD